MFDKSLTDNAYGCIIKANKCSVTGGLKIVQLNYKKMIIEMLEEIDNEDFLFKIYHYILAKHRRCIEKKKQGED